MPRLKVVMPVDAGRVRRMCRKRSRKCGAEELRLLEAMLFASAEPLDEKALAARLPQDVDVHAALVRLQEEYAPRGVNLVRINGKWTFRTATDLSWLLSKETIETRKLSRAAIETLAIIAYHQPVTRAEIEDIRGVSTSKGSVDVLLETGWITSARPPQGAGPPGDLRHHRGVPVAFRARRGGRSAGARRAQGLGPARRAAAAGLRGADAVGRSGAARRRGSARAGRPRSRPGAAAGARSRNSAIGSVARGLRESPSPHFKALMRGWNRRCRAAAAEVLVFAASGA